MTFQTKLFAAATAAALIALVVAGALFATTTVRQTDARIEQTLVAEAKLAAELLSRGAPASPPSGSATDSIAQFDPEADRIRRSRGRTRFGQERLGAAAYGDGHARRARACGRRVAESGPRSGVRLDREPNAIRRSDPA